MRLGKQTWMCGLVALTLGAQCASAAQLGLAANLTDTAPAVQHAQFLNFRADWIISSKHQLFVFQRVAPTGTSR